MQLNVALTNARYPIVIQSGALEDVTLLPAYVKGKQVLIVSNETVAPLYLDKVRLSLSAYDVAVVILPDGEVYKNQESLNSIYNALIDNKFNRDATLIALGGGVVGDVCGFAAATYQRGVSYIQVPTTLLAQVDASVGGKTAINHPLGKNLIGCFYQPSAVIIDPDTLFSLEEREYKSGMAEVIKYAFISDKKAFDTISKAIEADQYPLKNNIESLIHTCCNSKAKFVIADEKEQGMRALLNFGHTYAHAFELATGYGRLLHGEAVAIGMYCAVFLSVQLGLCDVKYLVLLKNMLDACGLSYEIPKDLKIEAIMNAMLMDKKVLNKKLRLVLIKSPGNCFITDEVPTEVVRANLLKLMDSEGL